MSVSKIECKLTLRRKGDLDVGLYRHLAPMTVGAILRSLPISGRVTVYPGIMVCALTGIRTGVEKPRFQYGRGEVAFLAANGSICFFLREAKSEKPLNPVGKIDANLEIIERAGVGDVIELRLVQEATAQT